VTGPDHYREAERLLATAKDTHAKVVDKTLTAGQWQQTLDTIAIVVAEAQVHATLALAAATAASIRRNGAVEDADGVAAWERVLS
jgi:hypothetical protein